MFVACSPKIAWLRLKWLSENKVVVYDLQEGELLRVLTHGKEIVASFNVNDE